MNGTPPAEQETEQTVSISCGNCMWLSQIRANGEGECWYQPPQVVVLTMRRADVASAQMGVEQRPVKIRPMMSPAEYCAAWRLCPPNFERAAAPEAH